jgi:signal transduction histidine kinase
MIYDGSYGPLSDGVKETTIRINEASDRLIGLVGEFLDLRKIEEGRMEYRFDRIDIVDLVDNIVEELTVLAKNKNLELTFERPDADFPVMADKEKLRPVIQNHVENAIKYTEKGFVRVEIKAEKDTVLIAVTDSGRGMSQSLLPALFQQFSRDSRHRAGSLYCEGDYQGPSRENLG